MKILAVDTSTKSCSVAVTKDDNLISELLLASGQTHSIHLMAMVKQALKFAGIAIGEIDGYAVAGGPGTFTGLRIGLSTIKGLAAATGKPVVAISTLKALAFQAFAHTKMIYPMIDARRGEIYFAGYRQEKDRLIETIAPQAASARDFLSSATKPGLLIGNGAGLCTDLINNKADFFQIAPDYLHTLRASAVAHLSFKQFSQNKTSMLETLVPQYIRKSDAELNLAN